MLLATVPMWNCAVWIEHACSWLGPTQALNIFSIQLFAFAWIENVAALAQLHTVVDTNRTESKWIEWWWIDTQGPRANTINGFPRARYSNATTNKTSSHTIRMPFVWHAFQVKKRAIDWMMEWNVRRCVLFTLDGRAGFKRTYSNACACNHDKDRNNTNKIMELKVTNRRVSWAKFLMRFGNSHWYTIAPPPLVTISTIICA